MKIQKAVLLETKHVALGVLAGDVLMCGVFALLKRFDYSVPLGALLGTVCAVGNFFLLGLSIQHGMDKGEGMKAFMKTSFTLRMLMHVAVIVLAALLPCFQLAAAIVPLLLPRVVILVMQLLGMYKPEKKKEEKGGEGA